MSCRFLHFILGTRLPSNSLHFNRVEVLDFRSTDSRSVFNNLFPVLGHQSHPWSANSTSCMLSYNLWFMILYRRLPMIRPPGRKAGQVCSSCPMSKVIDSHIVWHTWVWYSTGTRTWFLLYVPVLVSYSEYSGVAHIIAHSRYLHTFLKLLGGFAGSLEKGIALTNQLGFIRPWRTRRPFHCRYLYNSYHVVSNASFTKHVDRIFTLHDKA